MKYFWRMATMLALVGLLVVSFLATLKSVNASAPTATTRYVAPAGNCGGASPCYATVQAAVDAASEGDVIKVAQGTYTDIHVRQGITQVVYVSKTVSIRGGYTTTNWTRSDSQAYPVVLDAQGKGRVFYIAGHIGPTISDLRVAGGDATGLGGDPWGDDAGGGIFADTFSIVLRNLIVQDGKAYRGGGVFLSAFDGRIESCHIFSNTADSGGGMYLLGGHARLERNIIRANTAEWGGGGLFINGTRTILANEVIIQNQALAYEAGGIFIYDSTSDMMHATFAANNSRSTVFVDNPGLSSTRSSVSMTNTIISGHNAVGVKLSNRKANTLTLTATLWYGNATNWDKGAGVLHHSKDYFGNPAFAADGYHLTAGSIAINKGVDAGVREDIDGDVRPWGGRFDLGADEYGAGTARKVYLPLALHAR